MPQKKRFPTKTETGTETDNMPINAIRQQAVSDEFQNNIDRRAFVLISPFPFMIIGEIVKVVSDFVYLEIETTNVDALEGRIIRVHLDDVEVFFIENDEVSLPRITDFSHKMRGDGS